MYEKQVTEQSTFMCRRVKLAAESVLLYATHSAAIQELKATKDVISKNSTLKGKCGLNISIWSSFFWHPFLNFIPVVLS